MILVNREFNVDQYLDRNVKTFNSLKKHALQKVKTVKKGKLQTNVSPQLELETRRVRPDLRLNKKESVEIETGREGGVDNTNEQRPLVGKKAEVVFLPDLRYAKDYEKFDSDFVI